MKKKTIVVNLLGAPGSGKSTLASSIFSKLKMKGVCCEIAMEFAKEVVWEKRFHTLQNQLYVFSEQFYRLWRINDDVSVIVTDSPILLSIYYNKTHEKKYQMPEKSFNELVLDCHKMFKNMNYFIKRNFSYEQTGRCESDSESKKIENEMISLYQDLKIPFTTVASSEEYADKIVNRIIKTLER